MTAAVVENETVETKDEGTDDLSAYQAAVNDADLSALNDTKSDDVRNIRTEYGKLTRKAKNLAKKWLDESAAKALDDEDFQESKRFVTALRNGTRVLSASVGRPAIPDADKRIQVLTQIQLGYAVAGAAAAADPEIGEGWQEKISVTDEDVQKSANYAAWMEAGMEGDEPEATAVQKAGARVSLGRGPNGQGRPKKSAE